MYSTIKSNPDSQPDEAAKKQAEIDSKPSKVRSLSQNFYSYLLF